MLNNIYDLVYNSGMDKSFVYLYNNQEYLVNITYKRIKSVTYRYRNGAFFVSCHRLTTMNKIKSGLDRFAGKLIKRNAKEQGEGEDYIYIFGQRIPLNFPGDLMFNNGLIMFDNREQLHKKLRKEFLKYLTDRTAYYASLMKAPNYQVKLREMRSRYGSNNRSKKAITYTMMLIYYSPDIIDSVVVHELTHCFVFDHSDKFYRLLYKYCPDYDILRKRLIKANF